MSRVIIDKDIDPDHWIFAVRAAKWMREHQDKHDALLEYGKTLLYVRRAKSAIIVKPAHG